ncbi:DUF2513 domain-containing protein [Lactobacillus sp. ESL0677]|uniref:DUF2513 domain-containing protein n=1 Tax=Lactobacillus sp. ESL0677 TaxID=2983208 RepID=UPI0023F762E2|nr:DUF2513 domain-containing protein [Lactobacillus sp. ESL0677]WEV36256.1 DUF2513 domain-containing protein [Lactobacillus sp. ESL0677]
MKLNKECVRKVLLYIEKSNYGVAIGFDNLVNDLSKYDKDTVSYTLLKLEEANYIKANLDSGMAEDHRIILSGGTINEITWSGHQFLDTIRDPKIWSKTKEVANKLEDISITLLSKIAVTVIEDVITGKIIL